MKYRFGKSSIERMKGVDARLIILVTCYLMLGKKDIGVTYGARTQEEQDDLLKKGNSKVSKSKHLLVEETLTTPNGFKIKILESNALDIIAYKNGAPIWEREYYKDIIEDIKDIVKFYGWEDIINFGWDFKSLDDPYHISVKEPGDGGIK